MKTHLILLTAFLLAGAVAAQSVDKSNQVVGTWLNQEKEARIEIYRDKNTYSGKIVWLKEPNNERGLPKVDDKNPDPARRSDPIVGLVLLRGFVYDQAEDEWVDGKIYDAREGKTYKCYLKVAENGTLKVRGYMGAAWMGLGKTNVWTRVN
ncbi:MAG: DUF2147 domain-containing protein [Cyclobacteriaceae bacterium]|jgi:uncharacterized protein (DUF2147 family)|nr:DUF2147 domain-containing protein [Cyclobacteriaceae bacterium]